MELLVTSTDHPSLSTSSSVYIEISRSTIITNLISSNTLKVLHNYEEDLVLNPGEYSFDLNQNIFDRNVNDNFS